jgi:hypothetical protein
MALAALAALDSGAFGGIFSLSLLVSNSANARSEKAEVSPASSVETRNATSPRSGSWRLFVYRSSHLTIQYPSIIMFREVD